MAILGGGDSVVGGGNISFCDVCNLPFPSKSSNRRNVCSSCLPRFEAFERANPGMSDELRRAGCNRTPDPFPSAEESAKTRGVKDGPHPLSTAGTIPFKIDPKDLQNL